MDAAKTGKLIRELRTEKALTQQELASLLKVSPTAVSKWENGRALPDISMLEPLVKVFNITFAEIILGERAARSAAEMEAAVETALNTDNMAEAAIKAVIDETISRKEKNVRKTIVMIAAGMTILAVLLFVTGIVWKIKNTPTLDLSGLENISSLPMEDAFTLDGKQYQPYLLTAYGSNYDRLMKELNVSAPEEIGKVVAYRYSTNGGIYYYYCTVDALPGDWLLMFQDDGTGVPSWKNATYLYCTQESLEDVPGWLKGLNN